MLDAIASCIDRIIKIAGAAGCGKTEGLVRHVAHLLEEEVSPDSILVETSTLEAARVFRHRLANTLESSDCVDKTAAEFVRIDTPDNILLTILYRDDAQAFTGRHGRVLADFEYKIFLEDVKTFGMARRQIRSYLYLYKKNWCADLDESQWHLGTHELGLFNCVKDLLCTHEAYLPEETAYLCSRFLQDPAGEQVPHYDYVLCDDYQNMSCAQQKCFSLLAKTQLVVAGNENETIPVASGYPNPDGFINFDLLRHNVTVFNVDEAYGHPAISRFCDALAKGAGMNPDLVAATRRPDPVRNEDIPDEPENKLTSAHKPVSVIKWNTPEDEFDGIGRYLFTRLIKHEDLQAGDITIVVPTKQWAQALEKTLRGRGLSTSSIGFCGVKGDPRNLSRAKTLVAYTTLNLLANPKDIMAWRVWCGFGNYLCNSEAWSELIAFSKEHSVNLLEGLEMTNEICESESNEPFLRADALAQRYRQGKEAICAHSNRSGYSLAGALGIDRIPTFKLFYDSLSGDETAPEMFELLTRFARSPLHSTNVHAVRISSAEQTVGCTFKEVIIAGCIDGFFPTRDAFEVVATDLDRATKINAGRKLFMSCAAKAQDALYLSTFSTADLELAEMSKMQVRRVRMVNGSRMATLSPTCFIEEAEHDAPPVEGGQTFLSCFGAD